jgi:hypothetical protein
MNYFIAFFYVNETRVLIASIKLNLSDLFYHR